MLSQALRQRSPGVLVALVLVPTLIAVVVLNLVTFFAFGVDKRRARLRRRRISEATLLGLAWATGLIGGWIAMSYFRHKTHKRSFRIRMVFVSIVNLLWIVAYLLWKSGEST